jgi:hypothetical protein
VQADKGPVLPAVRVQPAGGSAARRLAGGGGVARPPGPATLPAGLGQDHPAPSD